MRRSISWLGAVMGILLSLVTTSYAGEEEVALDKVPKPILEAVNSRFKNAEVTEAAKEQDDDEKLVYELSLKVEGQNVDVILTPEGEFRVIEKTITAKNLPGTVSKALEDTYPKATYNRLEEVIKVEDKADQPASYEALLVTAKKKKLEVELTAEGKILKEKEASD